jgi:hypothetical protein
MRSQYRESSHLDDLDLIGICKRQQALRGWVWVTTDLPFTARLPTAAIASHCTDSLDEVISCMRGPNAPADTICSLIEAANQESSEKNGIVRGNRGHGRFTARLAKDLAACRCSSGIGQLRIPINEPNAPDSTIFSRFFSKTTSQVKGQVKKEGIVCHHSQRDSPMSAQRDVALQDRATA